MTRSRRYAIRGLLVAATILTVVGIFAVFANRQVLNSDNWSETSTELLADSQIRSALSAYLVDEAYNSVDVRAEVAASLPPRLQPLAGPAANAVRTLAERSANRFLGRPRVQEAWKTANKATAQQFINIAEGDSKAITQSGNAVVLDLRVVLLDIVRRLGLPGTLANKIPPNAAKLKIMSGNQVQSLQNGASALKGLAIVLPALALILFGLAVYLDYDRRRHTLMVTGICLVIAGALVLIGRNVAGDSIVESLTTTEASKTTGEHVWVISTGILQDVAQAAIIMGIPIIIAAWLAGPSGLALSFRRTTAPWMRDRPGLTYGVVAALVLLVIAWAPIPATRMVIPVLILIGLVIFGVEALRRQTATEFPDATTEDVRATLRAAVASARGRNGATRPPSHDGDRLAHLERLSVLHDSGALNDEEFAAEKAALGAGGAPA
jgi:hypothetical protein